MAKRLILSMLALLTGLFAQIAPAQAQPCAPGVSEIGMVLGAAAAVDAAVVQAGSLPASRADGRIAPVARPASFELVAATVLIGIDRARQ